MRPSPWIRCRSCALALSIAGFATGLYAAEQTSLRDDQPHLQPGDEAQVGWNARYFASIPHDAGRIVTAPARWTTSEWIEAGAIAGAGIALYAEDERIQGWMQRRRSTSTDHVAHIVKPFGREYAAVALVGFAIASPFCDDPRVTRTALLGGESLLFAGIGYEGLQLLTNRPRPDTGAGRDAWGGPALHGGNHSYPSGHTTAAFAVATIAADEWSGFAFVPPVAYGLAAAVGLSRMNDDAHWASDAFTGAVLGYACASAVEYLHRSRRDISIRPVIGPQEKSLAVSWSF